MPDFVQAAPTFDKPTRKTPEQFQFIRFQLEGSVARLTLNHPEHNLLNEAMLRELADAGDLVDTGVRARIGCQHEARRQQNSEAVGHVASLIFWPPADPHGR